MIIEELTINPKLLLLGGSEIDIRDLYWKMRNQLEQEKMKHEKQVNKSRKLQEEIAGFDRRIREQMERLEEKERSLQGLSKHIREQQQTVDRQKAAIEEQLQQIGGQREQITEQQQQIGKQTNKLKKQDSILVSRKEELAAVGQTLHLMRSHIAEKQDTIRTQARILSTQANELSSQKKVLLLTVSLSILLVALGVAVFTAYRIKVQTNKELEKNVAERTEALRLANDQLKNEITERISTEKELIASEKKYRDIAAKVPGVVFQLRVNTTDGTRRFSYISPRAEDLFELSSDPDSPDWSFEKFQRLHSDDAEAFNESIENAIVNCSDWHFEGRILTTTGEIKWFEAWSSPTRTDNTIVFNGVLLDITAYKKSAEQARIQQEQLVRADKLTSLGLLVSGVAHEINNPNNLVMLNADVINTLWRSVKGRVHIPENESDKPLCGSLTYSLVCEKMESLIKGVSSGAQRIKRIVADLKSFSRDNVTELTEEVSLPEVVESAYVLVGSLIRKATTKYHVTCTEALPRVRGNFQKLEQVVINLLTNAAQALTSTNDEIEVMMEFARDRKELVLSVRDTGKGIPEEALSKIMDPFYTTKRDVGGTGLGLSVSYGIIEEHGGTIEIESEMGKGTVFRLYLPVIKTPAPIST